MNNQTKGRMLRMTLGGGQARVFLCDVKALAQEARDIHHASNVCTAAMGRMLAAGAILGAQLKTEGDTITATINGGGPAGTLTVVAHPNGHLKVSIDELKESVGHVIHSNDMIEGAVTNSADKVEGVTQNNCNMEMEMSDIAAAVVEMDDVIKQLHESVECFVKY